MMPRSHLPADTSTPASSHPQLIPAAAFMSAGSMLVFHSTLAHRGVAGDGVSTRPTLFMMLGLRPTRYRPLAFAPSSPTDAVVFKFDTNSARANGASLAAQTRADNKRRRASDGVA